MLIPQRGGLPHSDTSGSKPARGSPKIFAACHVLLRLLAPRHPPDALLLLNHRQRIAAPQPRTGPIQQASVFRRQSPGVRRTRSQSQTTALSQTAGQCPSTYTHTSRPSKRTRTTPHGDQAATAASPHPSVPSTPKGATEPDSQSPKNTKNPNPRLRSGLEPPLETRP